MEIWVCPKSPTPKLAALLHKASKDKYSINLETRVYEPKRTYWLDLLSGNFFGRNNLGTRIGLGWLCSFTICPELATAALSGLDWAEAAGLIAQVALHVHFSGGGLKQIQHV